VELIRDSLRLAIAPNHPAARQRAITLVEAAREPFIAYSRKEYPEYHEMLAALFGKTKSSPRIVEEHDGVSSLISAVAAGNGVALVPGSMACITGTRLKLLALSPVPELLVIGAAWPKAGLSPAAAHFLACAKAAIPMK
jgi:LysR family transcriptional regulator, benzoate and cis,cis-muconate-responsive activator of ben and cat genes